MKKIRGISLFWIAVAGWVITGCSVEPVQKSENKLEQYRAEKHRKDSAALEDERRTIAFYQSAHDSLVPVVDSLLALFKYEEKNPKYQDHGYYVLTGATGTRIMVRDDGQDLLLYKNGKRLDINQFEQNSNEKDYTLYERALHLKITMNDILELEKRINHASLEITKYERRLDRNP